MLMKKKGSVYAFWILLTEAVGLAAALLIRGGVDQYGRYTQKPAFAPPAALFPIVWIILYALMGIGVARADLTGTGLQRKQALRVFALQLGFNFLWSILFFNFRAYGLAFVWLAALWALILIMVRRFWEIDRPAAWLQLPYLLWVLFAGALNYGVWILNR